jgi:hypothetical protein
LCVPTNQIARVRSGRDRLSGTLFDVEVVAGAEVRVQVVLPPRLVRTIAAMKTWRLATVKTNMVPEGGVMFVNFVTLETLESVT